MASLGSLGSLVVSLGLDAAEFTRGLTKAELQSQRFAQNLDKSIAIGARAAGAALAVLGSAAVSAFVAIDNLAKSAANFKDLEEKTGASAEGLASLAVAATVGGTSMEEIAQASIKLTKNLTGVDDESTKAGAALAALGIPIKEFKELDPAAQMERLAKALDKFQDGAGKTAVLEALAKGGAQLLPFLKELEASGGRQVILTQKQIEIADQYADQQTRVIAQTKLYAQAAATQALPAITALIQASTSLIDELLGLDKTTSKLRDSNAISDFANGAVRVLAVLIDQVDAFVRTFQIVGAVIGATAAQANALSRLDFKGFSAIQEEASADIKAIKDRQSVVSRFEAQLEQQRKNDRQRSIEDRGFNPKPPVRFTGADKPEKARAKSDADDIAKRELQGRIKAFENAIREEQDILRARENFLQGYYRDDQLGIREYFSKRQELILEALAKEQDAFDKQIQTLKAFAGDKEAISVLKASTADRAELARIDSFAGKASAKERIEVEEKIADVVAKKAKAQQEAALKSINLSIDETKSVDKFGESLERVTVQLEALRGNQVSAASLGFDLQNKELNNLIKQQLDSTDAELRRNAEVFKEKQSQSKSLVVDQARLSAEQEKFGLIIDEIGIKQARIDLARRTGSITTLEALVQESDANTARIAKLTAVADAYEQIAIKAGDKRAIAAVEQMRLKIDELAASSDLLAKKFNDIFSGAFAEGLTSIVTGVGSFTDRVKNAVKDMEKSIVRSLSNIASQNIAESLFGKTGALGGVGGFFASLFGGAKGAAGSAGADSGAAGAAGVTAADTALLALGTTASTTTGTLTAIDATLLATSTTATALTTALTSVSASATSAAAALSTVAAPSAVSATAETVGGTVNAAGATAADASLLALSTTATTTTASLAATDATLLATSTAASALTAALTSATTSAATSAAGSAAADASLLALSTAAVTTTGALTAADAALLATSGTAGALSVAFASVAAAAASAAAALATVAASSTASGIAGAIGGFAKGGNPPVGKLSLVGERGPELFVPRVAGTIIPNDRIKTVLHGIKDGEDLDLEKLSSLLRRMPFRVVEQSVSERKPIDFPNAGRDEPSSASEDRAARLAMAIGSQSRPDRSIVRMIDRSPAAIPVRRNIIEPAVVTPQSRGDERQELFHQRMDNVVVPRANRDHVPTSQRNVIDISAPLVISNTLSLLREDRREQFAQRVDSAAVVPISIREPASLSDRRNIINISAPSMADTMSRGDGRRDQFVQRMAEDTVSRDIERRVRLTHGAPVDTVVVDGKRGSVRTQDDEPRGARATRIHSPTAATENLIQDVSNVFSIDAKAREPVDIASRETAVKLTLMGRQERDDDLAKIVKILRTGDMPAGRLAMSGERGTDAFVPRVVSATVKNESRDWSKIIECLINSWRSGNRTFASLMPVKGFASGGNPPVNRASIVGEDGPELFVPRVAGTIVPNDRLGGNVIHINQTVMPGASTASARQAALMAADAVGRQVRRR